MRKVGGCQESMIVKHHPVTSNKSLVIQISLIQNGITMYIPPLGGLRISKETAASSLFCNPLLVELTC